MGAKLVRSAGKRRGVEEANQQRLAAAGLQQGDLAGGRQGAGIGPQAEPLEPRPARRQRAGQLRRPCGERRGGRQVPRQEVFQRARAEKGEAGGIGPQHAAAGAIDREGGQGIAAEGCDRRIGVVHPEGVRKFGHGARISGDGRPAVAGLATGAADGLLEGVAGGAGGRPPSPAPFRGGAFPCRRTAAPTHA
ncbi:hypothetical protein [Methylobrevis pamukkalensis]|uniref:hypothetical protein n=1 Tax=Methylobrevis pamukkalensis TaxID=1439726 RepID=UPI001471B025|nr:hypothetical protein [Methylobrevis pamukkalensis]